MNPLYPIRGTKIAYLIVDAAILAVSIGLSYIILFYPNLAPHLDYIAPHKLIALMILVILSYYFFQIYRIMWTYSNISDIYRLLLANLAGFGLFLHVYHCGRLELFTAASDNVVPHNRDPYGVLPCSPEGLPFAPGLKRRSRTRRGIGPSRRGPEEHTDRRGGRGWPHHSG